MVEVRIFTESDFFDSVLMIEELIEDFVFQVLPNGDEGQFRNHFLCNSERIPKLQTTKALKHYFDSTLARERWKSKPIFSFLRGRNLTLGYSLGAAALIAALLVVSLNRTS